MDMLRRLNDEVLYIESHLCDDSSPDEIARIACIPYDSFVRFFGYLTGMTLKEYMRRRKLTLAAYELLLGETRIIDAAVKYGWDSADAFSRAFRAQHGVLPSKVRGAELRIYPPVSFHISTKGAKEMKLRIMKTEEIRLLGFSKPFTADAAGRFDEEHIMWAEESDRYSTRLSTQNPGIWYGIWNRGIYAIAKKPEEVVCTDAEEIVIPAGEYAVVTSEFGGFAGEELPRLREQLFSQWLPESGYTAAGDYEVEVYHLFPREQRNKRQYELWVPIKPG